MDLNEDTPLWRYIDLYKLEDMLKTSSLFFAFRYTFTDACEGKDNKYHQLKRKIQIAYENASSASFANQQSGNTGGTLITFPNARNNCLRQNLDHDLDNIGINCWTLHEDYNHGMPPRFVRKKFLPSKKFVGIRTSYQNILRAFYPSLKKQDMLYHKEVQYHCNYETANTETCNDWDHLFHMGDEWSTEKEYRFILSLNETFNEIKNRNNPSKRLLQHEMMLKCIRSNKIEGRGFRIPININALNMRIYCPSKDTQDFVESLKRKYGFLLIESELI